MAKYISKLLAGPVNEDPSILEDQVSPTTLELIDDCFSDLPGRLYDGHTHIAGIGYHDSGCTVNKMAFQPFRHPYFHTKFLTMIRASGVKNVNELEEEYLEHMIKFIDWNQKHYNYGKHLLLSLDKWFDEDGTEQPKYTTIYVPNEFVYNISQRYSQYIDPAISVHPFRPNAIEELNKWGRIGVKVIKWLPPAQGIDPSHPKCDKFYEVAKKHDMTLLCHTGKEVTLNHQGAQHHFGNPLNLRRALDHGMTVIAAHYGSLGSDRDFEENNRKRKSYQLALKLMDEKKYKNQLFVDLTACAQFNRIGDPLTSILDRDDLHDNLVNGTDYPLPNIAVTTSTIALQWKGYITSNERKMLNEIYKVNPLLYDFVTKRLLKSPITGNCFPPSVFVKNPKVFGID